MKLKEIKNCMAICCTNIEQVRELDKKMKSGKYFEDLSAEEALLAYDQMCRENYCCSDCPIYGIIGKECTHEMDGHITEIVDAIKKWKSDHEKKEPEIEWFWKSYVVGGSDYKEADTEQEAMEWCEYYAKEHPEVNCTYKRVCRVKAVE